MHRQQPSSPAPTRRTRSRASLFGSIKKHFEEKTECNHAAPPSPGGPAPLGGTEQLQAQGELLPHPRLKAAGRGEQGAKGARTLRGKRGMPVPLPPPPRRSRPAPCPLPAPEGARLHASSAAPAPVPAGSTAAGITGGQQGCCGHGEAKGWLWERAGCLRRCGSDGGEPLGCPVLLFLHSHAVWFPCCIVSYQTSLCIQSRCDFLCNFCP